jgi:formate dehydrogenase
MNSNCQFLHQTTSFEEVDWDTAVREVAAGFLKVRDKWGSASIFYYSGGGQGNHLVGAYGNCTRRALGSMFRSNALAQEKTGEFWVDHMLFGTGLSGSFPYAEVAVFVGKNPWQSHGFQRARPPCDAALLTWQYPRGAPW